MDVVEAIYRAWRRVRPLLDDEHELARRLARRHKPLLTRPPRAWCIALRASDRRLEDAAHVAPSVHPSSFSIHPSESVSITHSTLLKLSLTINLPGNSLDQAAARLGTTQTGLRNARIKDTIKCRYAPARRGKPTPILSAPDELDPNSRLFTPADPVWDWTRTFLHTRIRPDFAQTLTRVACYTDCNKRYADKSHLHPEHPAVDPIPTQSGPKRIPPPPPDGVWYKWKGDEYIGYDWKAAEKNPRIRINYERQQRRLAKQRGYNARRPKRSQSQGSLIFRGWAWLCPHCQKTCRTLFLPVPPQNVLEGYPMPPLAKLIDIPRTIQGFACKQCHGVRYLSRLQNEMWNDIVAHLTAGLLYGKEVERPPWLTKDRKRPYQPQINARPALQREKVLTCLLEGKSRQTIAAELHMTDNALNQQIHKIFKQHGVHTHRDLLKKHHRPLPPHLQLTRNTVRV